MKQFLLLIFAMILLSFFSSCMKYEDGPFVSFKSEQNRLQGEWLLKYFTVNGTDSLEFYNNYYGQECMFSFRRFGDENSYSDPYEIIWGDTANNYYKAVGSYEGIGNEFVYVYDYIDFSTTDLKPLSYLAHAYLCNGCNSLEWPLTKLKYHEVWFKISINDKEYELHLENIKKY